MSSKSMADRIREYDKANPGSTAVQVAAALKIKARAVHQVRWLDKKRAVKGAPLKRGRPPKNAVTVKPATPTQGQIIVRTEVGNLHVKVDRLTQQNMQLRTVISYLEHQLGLKDSQHGAAI